LVVVWIVSGYGKKYWYETADGAVYEVLKRFSIRMRKYPTEAESIMWLLLSSNSLGVHFRRQHIIGDYIADFICIKSMLIIEIDGGYHFVNNQIVKDTERTQWLESQGYTVLRFTNEEVICDTDNVLSKIKTYLQTI